MTNETTCPIIKFEKILLATDGTVHSEGAIREAIKFASKCSSKIFAVMTLETNPEYESIGSSALQKEEIDASKHLESIKTRAEREGLTCETILHESMDAAQAIVDEATKNKVDVIVIGRRLQGRGKVLDG
jgi:nucleotide-binding universal stress UspA family protein